MSTTAVRSFSVKTEGLFVVGSTALTASDTMIRSRLQALGFIVTVKDGTSAQSTDANGKSLIVISSTVSPASVGTKFRTSAVPVIVWESGLFSNMGMTGSGNKDVGTSARQTQIQILSPTHALAGGLTGTITIYAPRETVSWGKPNTNAAKVASILGDSTKVAIFGYTAGSGMFGLNAPAKRIGLFVFDTFPLSFNTNAWTLFDAAVLWATQ